MKTLRMIFIISSVFLCTNLIAGIINVPADTSTIQGGIFLADVGDTILVADGTYYENINYKGKAITVSSLFLMDGDTSHISKTIIDGSMPTNPDSASVVYFESGEDTTSILCGFTITGGSGTNIVYENFLINDGGGILIYESGAKILHNRITKNIINEPGRYCYGGGIGVWCLTDNQTIMQDNEISHNSVFAYWGGGGGADLSNAGKLLFKNNFVHHNLFDSKRDGHGGGIISLGGSDGIKGEIFIINNMITHNEVKGQTGSYGGGVYSEYPELFLYNNLIAHNKARLGGGLFVTFWSHWLDITKVRLINNTITGNTALSGGAIRNKDSDVIIFNSILWDNPANEEIYSTSGANLDVRYCDVKGGWTGEGNIDSDPGFYDSYFNLYDTSACVGSGIDSIEVDDNWYKCPSTDYYGNQRPHPIDNLVDIGAIESDFPTGILDYENYYPYNYYLFQNYPNPFNPSTTIEFTLPKSEFVELKVYNILGKEMAELVSNNLSAGVHQYQFDGSKLATGVYYYQIIAGEYREVKKMILLR